MMIGSPERAPRWMRTRWWLKDMVGLRISDDSMSRR
jgi:hypothetical protein